MTISGATMNENVGIMDISLVPVMELAKMIHHNEKLYHIITYH